MQAANTDDRCSPCCLERDRGQYSLSDLWQHLRSHPMLELASLRELAGKYQSIETSLIDEGCLLLATERVDGVAFCDVILHDMFAKSITRVAIA